MKTKMYVLSALVVFGVISTSYARQEAFIEFKERKAEKAIVHEEVSADRTPAQSFVKSQEQIAQDNQAQRERFERYLYRRQ